MAVQFVLGRAGTGKTRFCLDGVMAGLDAGGPLDGPRLILLVPEQASFQMEHMLARRAPGGAYARAEVLSFTRLAQRVFSETGAVSKTLSPSARQMALRQIVQQMGERLGPWQEAGTTAGFLRELDRLLTELLREDESPEALRQAAKRCGDSETAERGRRIAAVLEAYLAWLGRDRIDPAAEQRVLRERLAIVPWVHGAEIWVDGFAAFSGQEAATLVELAQRAAAMRITLLLDPASPVIRQGAEPDALGLFYKTERTFQRLVQRLTKAGVEIRPPVELPQTAREASNETGAVPPRFHSAPRLAALEAGLAQGSPAAPATGAAGSGQVRILTGATHRDELREAARLIHRRVRSGAARYRDFALIARDLAPLADLAADVLDEYEIPYFIDARRPLAGHPLVRLLDALLSALDDDLSLDSMTRLLRTGLLPLTRTQSERLENQLIAYEIRGRRLWSQRQWDCAAESRARTADDTAARLDEARFGLVAAVQVVLGRAQQERPPGHWWATALLELLETLEVPRALSRWIQRARAEQDWEDAEIHRLAWEAVCETLGDVRELLGNAPLSTRDISAVVMGALRDRTLALAPPTLDQVLVGSIDRSRHPEIRHAWLMAMNDGVFPPPAADGTLLSRRQREQLSAGGSALRPGDEDVLGERLLAYIACTRPSQTLTISYATVGEDGGALQPSPLLAEIARALPELRAEARGAGPSGRTEVQSVEERAAGSPATLRELAWMMLETPPHDEHSGRLAALCERLRTSAPADIAARLTYLLRGTEYRNDARAVPPFRRTCGSPDQPVWLTSASEVETWLQCPFQHFARYGLKLEAARGPRHVASDIGEDLHRILAAATRRAIELSRERKATLAELSVDDWRAALRPAIDEHLAELSDAYRQRRPQAAFLRALLPSLAEDVLLAHAARLRRGEFAPQFVEESLSLPAAPERGSTARTSPKATGEGLNPAVQGVLIPLGQRRVALIGQIDRIDVRVVGDRTQLLVYDYKSSVDPKTPGEFLVSPWLQAFAYALAAPALPAFDAARTDVAGVFLAPLFADLEAAEDARARGEDDASQRMHAFKPRGRLLETVRGAVDRETREGRSPVIHLTLNREGVPWSGRSDAVSPEQFAEYIRLARETLGAAAAGVEAGIVSIAPLVHRRTLACQTCDYRPVCRFERSYNRPRPAETSLPVISPDDAGAEDAE